MLFLALAATSPELATELKMILSASSGGVPAYTSGRGPVWKSFATHRLLIFGGSPWLALFVSAQPVLMGPLQVRAQHSKIGTLS